MKTTNNASLSFDLLEDCKLDNQELLTIRGGDGPEIDPNPQPIILPEEG
jgi:hypothetical protein